LNAAIANTGAGLFLPLAGGILTGSLASIEAEGDLFIAPHYNGKFNTAISRNWPTPTAEIYRFDYAIGGTVAGGQQAHVEFHAVNGDTVDASSAQGGGLGWFSMAGSLNAGAVGGRTAFGSSLTQNGATTCAPGQYYVAGSRFADAAYSAGGASGSNRGSLFAGNDSVHLRSGGMYWESIVGCELDVSADAGTNVNYKIGLSVVTWATDAVGGNAGHDYAVGISAQAACAGWNFGYAIGSDYGWWPMKNTSTLIGTIPAKPGGPAYQAAHGIDFSAVTFTADVFKSNGFVVDGNGRITVHLDNAANDAAAATAGTGPNQLYRNGGIVQVRLT
jgi:hypothetical protein